MGDQPLWTYRRSRPSMAHRVPGSIIRRVLFFERVTAVTAIEGRSVTCCLRGSYGIHRFGQFPQLPRGQVPISSHDAGPARTIYGCRDLAR